MSNGVEVVLGWPVIKWLAGGAATLIGVLGAVIWKKQANTLQKLGDKVESLDNDSHKYATHEHLEMFRTEVKEELRSMNTALDNHNSEVTRRLDTVLVEVLRLNAKANNRRKDDDD